MKTKTPKYEIEYVFTTSWGAAFGILESTHSNIFSALHRYLMLRFFGYNKVRIRRIKG